MKYVFIENMSSHMQCQLTAVLIKMGLLLRRKLEVHSQIHVSKVQSLLICSETNQRELKKGRGERECKDNGKGVCKLYLEAEFLVVERHMLGRNWFVLLY